MDDIAQNQPRMIMPRQWHQQQVEDLRNRFQSPLPKNGYLTGRHESQPGK